MRSCQIFAAIIVSVLSACGGSSSSTAPVAPPAGPPTPPTLLPPVNLRYSTNPATYTVGVRIAVNAPSSEGGAVTGYDVSPALPAGLVLAPSSGEISGTPTTPAASTAYAVTATNAAGHTTTQVVITVAAPAPTVTVPGAPTGVQAVAGNASATLSWIAPQSDGGSPITGYVVTSSPVVANAVVAFQDTHATVTGLTNGSAYAFTVSAVNAVGTGPASTPSASVRPAAPTTPPPSPPPSPPPPTPPPAATTPGAPTGVAGVAGDRSASLTWNAPSSDGGSAITGYTVTPSPAAPAATVAVNGTTANVTGLSNGTTYTFTVRARNAVGTGPASTASAGLTPRASDALAEGLHVLAVVLVPDPALAVPVGGLAISIALPAGTSIAVAGSGSDEIPASALVAGSAISGARMLSGSFSAGDRRATIALAVAPDVPWSGQAARVAFTVAPGALVTASEVVSLNTPLPSLKVVGFDETAHRTIVLTDQVRVTLQILAP